MVERSQYISNILRALFILALFSIYAPVSFAQSVDVWVNSNSKVYHCPGARWYGKTKKGFFQDEVKAIDKGYRPARNVRCSNAGRTAVNQIADTVHGNIKVWVNLKSHVYHCPGARWYGKTKRGEFMGEGKALKEGNRPSRGQRCG